MKKSLLVATALIASMASACAAQHHGPDLTKPTFTTKDELLCVTKQGMSDFLEHVRAGVDVPPSDYACTFFPGEGWPVTVLETDGDFDIWAKVSMQMYNGAHMDRWTLLRQLQN
jgi:hypothetical protein